MLTKELEQTLQRAINIAKTNKQPNANIEHLALALIGDKDVTQFLCDIEADVKKIEKQLKSLVEIEVGSLTDEEIYHEISPGMSFQKVVHKAAVQANLSGISRQINGLNILAEILAEDNDVSILFSSFQINRLRVVNYLVHGESVITSNNDFLADPLTRNNKKILEEDSEGNTRNNPSLLNKYCSNLNELASNGEIDPITGRETEINRLIEILTRRSKNNPLLIGESGVGKTAIIEGLAYQIEKGNLPEQVNKLKIYSLDLGSMLAGTRYRGDFEDRMKKIIEELEKTPNAVLFIDETHNIIGAGSTNGGALDASNLLKPALARGKIKCIGALSHSEYSKHFLKDSSLSRRFHVLQVDEPTTTDTLMILKGKQKALEKFHNVKFKEESLISAIELSKRYIPDKYLPDKAIDILDEAASCISLWRSKKSKATINKSNIEQTVSRMVQIPVVSISKSEAEQLQMLESNLKHKIYGQDKAISSLCASVKLSKAGLNDGKKPIGCYLFSGPTGVGKTELAIQLSKELNMNFIRFDMSEYMEQHSVAKLIGTPPGYVGFEGGGKLTDEIRKSPYSVLLLDEMEKAHSDLNNILLQIMDYGSLTDHQGRKVNFRNCIVIITSNAGAAELSRETVGFDNITASRNSDFTKAIEKVFSPEFRNRLDGIIPFNSLSKFEVEKIALKFIEELRNSLQSHNMQISLSNKAFDYICSKGYDPLSGARIMNRVINENIKSQLADLILFGKERDSGQINIDVKDNKIIVKSCKKGLSNNSKCRKKIKETAS